MNIGKLLGAMVQSGMSASSNDRMKNSLGGGGVLGNLANMLGKSSGQAGGSGGIADIVSSVLGGGQQGARASGAGGGIGDLLSNILGDAGKAVGGNKTLAIGGLGALVGSLMGGGLMALLGMLAFNALKGSSQQQPQIPVGLLEPQTKDEQEQLEQGSEIVLRAMINATKSDGRVDQNEINRIMGKFSENSLRLQRAKI